MFTTFLFLLPKSNNKQLPARRVKTFTNFVPMHKGIPLNVDTVTTKGQEGATSMCLNYLLLVRATKSNILKRSMRDLATHRIMASACCCPCKRSTCPLPERILKACLLLPLQKKHNPLLLPLQSTCPLKAQQ